MKMLGEAIRGSLVVVVVVVLIVTHSLPVTDADACFRKYVKKHGYCKSPLRGNFKNAMACCSNGKAHGYAANLEPVPTKKKGNNKGYLCFPCSDIKKELKAGWASWAAWGSCSASCGQGYQERSRECRGDARKCVPDGSSYQVRPCVITHSCSMDGKWGAWEPWQPCSTTCGQGRRVRMRYCDNPAPQNGGKPCRGDGSEVGTCRQRPCQVDGQWSTWSEFSTCNATCGRAVRLRTRRCDSPPPSPRGSPCRGPSQQLFACQLPPCPVDGGWTAWGPWSACPATCGDGEIERRRACVNPPPKHGGRACPGADRQMNVCNSRPCPVNGAWTRWSEWSECEAKCREKGFQLRSRHCADPKPQFGGHYCSGAFLDKRPCIGDTECPVDGGWTHWGYWTQCPVTCGRGEQRRSRNCSNPEPQNGGRYCHGPTITTRRCPHLPPCFPMAQQNLVDPYQLEYDDDDDDEDGDEGASGDWPILGEKDFARRSKILMRQKDHRGTTLREDSRKKQKHSRCQDGICDSDKGTRKTSKNLSTNDVIHVDDDNDDNNNINYDVSDDNNNIKYDVSDDDDLSGDDDFDDDESSSGVFVYYDDVVIPTIAESHPETLSFPKPDAGVVPDEAFPGVVLDAAPTQQTAPPPQPPQRKDEEAARVFDEEFEDFGGGRIEDDELVQEYFDEKDDDDDDDSDDYGRSDEYLNEIKSISSAAVGKLADRDRVEAEELGDKDDVKRMERNGDDDDDNDNDDEDNDAIQHQHHKKKQTKSTSTKDFEGEKDEASANQVADLIAATVAAAADVDAATRSSTTEAPAADDDAAVVTADNAADTADNAADTADNAADTATSSPSTADDRRPSHHQHHPHSPNLNNPHHHSHIPHSPNLNNPHHHSPIPHSPHPHDPKNKKLENEEKRNKSQTEDERRQQQQQRRHPRLQEIQREEPHHQQHQPLHHRPHQRDEKRLERQQRNGLRRRTPSSSSSPFRRERLSASELTVWEQNESREMQSEYNKDEGVRRGRDNNNNNNYDDENKYGDDRSTHRKFGFDDRRVLHKNAPDPPR